MVTYEVHPASIETFREVWAWLQDDPSQSEAALSVGRPEIEERDMGHQVLSWLNVELPNLLALPGFIDCLWRWTRAQPASSPTTITMRQGANEIEITANMSAADIERLLAVLKTWGEE